MVKPSGQFAILRALLGFEMVYIEQWIWPVAMATRILWNLLDYELCFFGLFSYLLSSIWTKENVWKPTNLLSSELLQLQSHLTTTTCLRIQLDCEKLLLAPSTIRIDINFDFKSERAIYWENGKARQLTTRLINLCNFHHVSSSRWTSLKETVATKKR